MIMSEKPILLVEDSPEDTQLTLRALGKNHIANEVIVARDGVEAWEHLVRVGAVDPQAPPIPAVTLVDLKLPKVDGLEVLRRFRNHPRLRRLPVVILTPSNGGWRRCQTWGTRVGWTRARSGPP